jgi:hypothetical protein
MMTSFGDLSDILCFSFPLDCIISVANAPCYLPRITYRASIVTLTQVYLFPLYIDTNYTIRFSNSAESVIKGENWVI